MTCNSLFCNDYFKVPRAKPKTYLMVGGSFSNLLLRSDTTAV